MNYLERAGMKRKARCSTFTPGSVTRGVAVGVTIGCCDPCGSSVDEGVGVSVGSTVGMGVAVNVGTSTTGVISGAPGFGVAVG